MDKEDAIDFCQSYGDFVWEDLRNNLKNTTTVPLSPLKTVNSAVTLDDVEDMIKSFSKNDAQISAISNTEEEIRYDELLNVLSWVLDSDKNSIAVKCFAEKYMKSKNIKSNDMR